MSSLNIAAGLNGLTQGINQGLQIGSSIMQIKGMSEKYNQDKLEREKRTAYEKGLEEIFKDPDPNMTELKNITARAGPLPVAPVPGGLSAAPVGAANRSPTEQASTVVYESPATNPADAIAKYWTDDKFEDYRKASEWALKNGYMEDAQYFDAAVERAARIQGYRKSGRQQDAMISSNFDLFMTADDMLQSGISPDTVVKFTSKYTPDMEIAAIRKSPTGKGHVYRMTNGTEVDTGHESFAMGREYFAKEEGQKKADTPQGLNPAQTLSELRGLRAEIAKTDGYVEKATIAVEHDALSGKPSQVPLVMRRLEADIKKLEATAKDTSPGNRAAASAAAEKLAGLRADYQAIQDMTAGGGGGAQPEAEGAKPAEKPNRETTTPKADKASASSAKKGGPVIAVKVRNPATGQEATIKPERAEYYRTDGYEIVEEVTL